LKPWVAKSTSSNWNISILRGSKKLGIKNKTKKITIFLSVYVILFCCFTIEEQFLLDKK
jgi:hypothetical protein